MMHDWWTSGSWVFMLLPLALLGGLVLAVVRLYDGNWSREQSPRTAREILDERFSKGEIDREEYEMRRKALLS